MPPHIPQIRLYQDWLARERGLRFDSYAALWQWSVDDLDAFWQSIWDYFELQSPTPHRAVLADPRMPGAVWFPGAQVNYVRQVLRHVAAAHAAGLPAIVADNERGEVRELSWPELRRQVASLALTLRDLGVRRGDRVAAYLPNLPETIVACLATLSIGAVWSLCAPDMGSAAVLDRLRQIEPKLLIAADGVHYAGRAIDRSAVVSELRAGLPTARHLLLLRTPYAASAAADAIDLRQACARDDTATAVFEPEWLPFDHPIWIVYSSGTTGLPKPIVHGHGGILLTLLALKCLHNDIGCSYAANSFGERYHWYSSTGWVMWNAQMAGLATGTTVCIFDGNPGGPYMAPTPPDEGPVAAPQGGAHALGRPSGARQPDWTTLWRFAARHRVSFFGVGAAFYANCMKAGVDLAALQRGGHDLSRIRALGSTGSPLAEDVQRWGTAQIAALDSGQPAQRDIWWCNISGGTDFCGAFIGGNRELPQIPGQMQCRQLGCAVEAWDEQGRSVVGEVGELVCTRPIPSMPLYFWGDAGNARYLSSYFDTYARRGGKPAVWRHGDWLKVTPDGGCVIYGRSDATLNRHGLRMGTSEIYSAVEALPEVMDSLVVDLEYLGRDSYMPLFVVLTEGQRLDEALRRRIADAIRHGVSPRFVPDAIVQAPEVPRTLTGKKQELPIKKLLLGQPLDKVVNRDAMANPGCLAWYLAFAESRRTG